jgi:hypothetical protein
VSCYARCTCTLGVVHGLQYTCAMQEVNTVTMAGVWGGGGLSGVCSLTAMHPHQLLQQQPQAAEGLEFSSPQQTHTWPPCTACCHTFVVPSSMANGCSQGTDKVAERQSTW